MKEIEILKEKGYLFVLRKIASLIADEIGDFYVERGVNIEDSPEVMLRSRERVEQEVYNMLLSGEYEKLNAFLSKTKLKNRLDEFVERVVYGEYPFFDVDD